MLGILKEEMRAVSKKFGKLEVGYREKEKMGNCVNGDLSNM